LIRSATSVGANFREAQRGRTRNEFVSKLAIALQEAEETRYWLELVVESEMAPAATIKPLINEVTEFIAILVATIKTAKSQD
jgi:four helix bundle protein